MKIKIETYPNSGRLIEVDADPCACCNQEPSNRLFDVCRWCELPMCEECTVNEYECVNCASPKLPSKKVSFEITADYAIEEEELSVYHVYVDGKSLIGGQILSKEILGRPNDTVYLFRDLLYDNLEMILEEVVWEAQKRMMGDWS